MNDADEYISEQEAKVIENLWSARHAVTVDDTDWLAGMHIAYGDNCGLESTCPPEARIARPCADCGQPTDARGWCWSMRLYMDHPKRWDDVEFLRDCGIKPIAI